MWVSFLDYTAPLLPSPEDKAERMLPTFTACFSRFHIFRLTESQTKKNITHSGYTQRGALRAEQRQLWIKHTWWRVLTTAVQGKAVWSKKDEVFLPKAKGKFTFFMAETCQGTRQEQSKIPKLWGSSLYQPQQQASCSIFPSQRRLHYRNSLFWILLGWFLSHWTFLS